ncbi:MAG: hypothetical protein ACRC62_04745 [Microcoleus sp.]
MGINWQKTVAVRLLALFAAVAVSIGGLVSCGDRALELPKPSNKSKSAPNLVKSISEVSPPETIQQLRQALEIYQPQIGILNPKPDEVLADTDVSVRFQVKDLPIFKDPNLGLGPHLQVILDNQPYKSIYDTSQPLVISNLEPGTHTLQVFASKPWEESFKNDGAYSQTTFHIFTKTADNNPDRTLPLLTYNQPQNTYGAQPIMLDFYLTNAPLHSVARADAEDEILDWKIRATVNGESFTLDRWQPIYLKGFKPGKNWVQLELLDEKDNPIDNVFNNTVRLVNYQPEEQDTLAKLVRGELTVADARGTVDRNYKPPTPKPTPELEQLPIAEPSPTVEQESVVEPTVILEEKPVKTIELAPTTTPEIEEPKEVESVKAIEPATAATPEIEDPKEVEPVKAIEPTPTVSPEITVPKIVESAKESEEQPTATEQLETQKDAEPVKASEQQLIAPPELEIPKTVEPVVSEPQPKATAQAAKQKIGEIVNSLRNYFEQVTQPKTPSKNLPQKLPEITEKAPIPQAAQPNEPEASPNLVTQPSPVPETTIAAPKEPTKSEQKVEFET